MEYEDVLLSLENDPSAQAMLNMARYLIDTYGIQQVRTAERRKLYAEATKDFSAPKDVIRPAIKAWYKEDREAIDAAWPRDLVEWVALFCWSLKFWGPSIYPDSLWLCARAFRERYTPTTHLMWKEPRLALIAELRRVTSG